MTTTATTAQPGPGKLQADARWYARERSLRLGAGIVLFVFLTMHLLNAAIGILGVDAMEAVQVWRVWLWQTAVGTVLICGAALVHILLAVKRIVGRRTWRMPLSEALQIALGLSIPLLVYEHAIGAGFVSRVTGADGNYAVILKALWPAKALTQPLLVFIAWGHGVIGLYFVLRAKPWYPRWREVLLVLAVLVPVLAIAGFISGAREALEFESTGPRLTPEQLAVGLAAVRVVNWVLLGSAFAILLAIGGLALSRRFGNRVVVRYLGHGEIRLPRGMTLLEGSRANGIPHPSLCGGRGRCSTCRVLVEAGGEMLAAPGSVEQTMLERISAPPRVRLACQIRPQRELSVRILLPLDTTARTLEWDDAVFNTGAERTATVLFVDVRAFTRLTQQQQPYDLVVLLNRFLAEMRQSVEAHGGRVTMFLSDGLMAVFGLNGERANGSRAALAAARDMLKAIDGINREFQAALPMPLRIGIGVHTGPIVVARIGDDEHGFMTVALGDTVTVASRLEAATKELLADALVSEATLKAAGQMISSGSRSEVHVAGFQKPVVAYGFALQSTLEVAA